MAIKSYAGKGAKHYTVKSREDKLNKKLEELSRKDANFESTFKPATNKEEFDALYNKYMIENAEYEEIKDAKNEKTDEADNYSVNEETTSTNNDTSSSSKNTTNNSSDTNDFMTNDKSFFEDESLPTDTAHGLDEMATKNVNTRDYVMQEGFKNDSDSASINNNTQENRTFDREPSSWDEAFKIPEPDGQQIFIDDNENGGANADGNTSFTKNNTSSGSSSSGGGQSSSSSRTSKQPPLNSSFNEMSGGKQRKQSKRMATMAVEVISRITEMTFEYYCNKDISHDKLIELQDQELIDLDFLIELEAGQQQAVRYFFMEQRLRAKELAKLSQDDKDDLIEALTDVLMEKGIALTPAQNLMMVGVSILFKQGMVAYSMSAQNKMILEYAMNHKAGAKEEQPQASPIVPEQKEESEVVQNIPTTNNVQSNTNNNSDFLTTENDLETELKESRGALAEKNEIKNSDDDIFVEGVSRLG